MNLCKAKTLRQLYNGTGFAHRSKTTGYASIHSRHSYTAPIVNPIVSDDHEDEWGTVKDISESVSSPKSALKVTSKDYYSQYSESFFKDSYQNMLSSIEQTDEFNPQHSLSKKIEETSLIPIEPGVIKSPSSILKITLKVTQEHLGEKKRIRLDEYLFRRLIFAVFHYTKPKEQNDDNLLNPIQLRFRLFGIFLLRLFILNFLEISMK